MRSGVYQRRQGLCGGEFAGRLVRVDVYVFHLRCSWVGSRVSEKFGGIGPRSSCYRKRSAYVVWRFVLRLDMPFRAQPTIVSRVLSQWLTQS